MTSGLRRIAVVAACSTAALLLACDRKPVQGTYLGSAPPPMVEVVHRGELGPASDSSPRVEPVVGSAPSSKVESPKARPQSASRRKVSPTNQRFEF
jgi:hypothetical protein